MKTVNKKPTQNKITPARKKAIDRAAKRIVKQYGKTLELLAKE